MTDKHTTLPLLPIVEPKVMRHLLAPETADAFTKIVMREIHQGGSEFQTHNQGLLKRNAIEVHGRNCPAMLGIHWGLTALVAREAGRDLLPSFAFFRLYFQGDVCRVHSDREACEISLSLTLAYSDGQPWDLSVGTSTDFDHSEICNDFGEEPYVSYAMQPGDGLLYSGSARRHGRVQPNPNRWSTHLFLQWVDPDGPHASEAFERLKEVDQVAP